MTSRKPAVFAGAAAAAFAVSASLAGTASAAPQPSADELSATAESLTTSLGNQFGGAWLENGELVVGVTDAAKADQVTAAGAEAKVVRHSVAALDAKVSKLNTVKKKAPDAVTAWGTNVRSNTVTMKVLPGHEAEARGFAESAGVSDVRLAKATEVPHLFADIAGGEAYNIGQSRCSVGFAVEGGFVTAGHCEALTGGGALSKDGTPLGEWGGSSFLPDDYAWVTTSGDWTPTGQVSGVGAVQGSDEAETGAAISKSGSTTGVTEGTIGEKNQTVNYPEGAVEGLTATDAQCEAGDSGGSFISDGQAQGVVSGGDTATCYFQPVNEILEAGGLTLVTG